MICFAWSGFPQYAARCVGAFVRDNPENEIVVIATRPAVPVQGMERLCGCKVVWVDANDEHDISYHLGRIPDKYLVTGWATPCFNHYRDQVRSAGGKTFQLIDHNFVQSVKELIKSIRFRVLFKSKYDGYMVPGKSGRQLLRYYGVADNRIFDGLYSADESLFYDGGPLEARDKRIVYVGQFCERKNVLNVCQAFVNSDIAKDGWTLAMYGCGPQKDALVEIAKRYPGIEINDFLQPEGLASVYRGARVFVLASKEEHWGLVVHEAALSGCYLLLSDRVGAGEDLLGQLNGRSFSPFNIHSMNRAFRSLMSLEDEAWQNARRESLRLSGEISINKFSSGVKNMLALC